MAEYRITNKAVSDLNEIWAYTFDQWSEDQADQYYNILLGLCEDIAKNPDLGKNYDGIRPDLLGLKANRHIIFYRIVKPGLTEITRILHSRMDLKNRIGE
ncbi:type II toxin-antitoxin system RelE/ParE family toxin [Balneolaceae bacterium ANBcel3]|nr:type II toxin-antitoxin system RelE/ParE family toxin [Balneolaceae bacterium ANBcel3]